MDGVSTGEGGGLCQQAGYGPQKVRRPARAVGHAEKEQPEISRVAGVAQERLDVNLPLALVVPSRA